MLPLLAAAVLCSPLGADPTGSVEGGGTVRLLAEHPTVSLDAEWLTFEPLGATTRVTARLEMMNHGEAATVPMGFPVPLLHPGSGQDVVKDFTVAIDGTGLEVTEDRQVRLVLAGSTPTCRWYRFAVPFEARQKRQMTVTYDLHGPGSPQLCYILATGGTWKDAIRSFELEVKLGERLNFHGLGLTGDRQPLPYEQQGASLIWRCRDYDGKPEVIWFSARPGPANVLLDGQKAWPEVRTRHQAGDVSLDDLYHLPCRWHEGRLLLSSELLARLLLVRIRGLGELGDGWQMLRAERQGTTCQVPAIRLPVRDAPQEPRGAYVEFAAAVAAFGGSITHRIDEAGDLEVSLGSIPDSVESARRLAGDAGLPTDGRLRCLRYLKRHAPAALAATALEIAGAPQQDWVVLLALVGHLADDPQPALTPELALQNQRPEPGTDRIGSILRAAQTPDEAVTRGAGLVLAELDARAAQERIVAALLERDGTWVISPGLLLCGLGLPDSGTRLVEALRGSTAPGRLDNGCIALGYLGDDAATPYLQSLIRGHRPVNDGVGDAASQALALLCTRRSLEVCAALLPERFESKWVARHLLEGLQRAAGVRPRYEYHYADRPAWARSLTDAEAKAVVLPLATGLKTTLPGNYGPLLEEIIVACSTPAR
jgi:hypothetical protein